MRREANIPLFLWIATAVLGHLMWGGGVDHGAKLLRQTLDIQSFARSVQNRARGVGAPIEVALLNDEQQEPEKKADPEDKKDEPEEQKPPQEEQADRDDPDAKKTPPPPKKPEKEPEKKEDPTLQKPEEKKPEPEKKVEPKSLEESKPAPQLELPHQVAVKQVVKDEHQADNPNAKFIADKANHVEEETQARVTSTDQNAADPQPGGNHSSSDPTPGDAEERRIAQSEDRAGDKYSAPNDQPQEAPQKLAMLKPAPGGERGQPRSAAEAQAQAGSRTGADHSKTSDAAQEGQKAQAASKATDPIPESLTADNGRFTVPGPRQAFVDQAERKARQEHPLPKRKSTGAALLGYGSAGTTASGINLNLDPTSAVAAIGRDQLRKEKYADGERRKSTHRGTWHAASMERWRGAIENYVPSVKPGNQTALNTAASPFASYLNEVHERIHPIFADRYLAALDQLPASNPLSNPDLLTVIEMGLDEDSGKIVRMGVVRASGVTAFDVNALEALQQASPFGPPPHEIVSYDGHVWFHWEFHRNQMACGTMFARPFILKAPPTSVPPSVAPPSQPPSDPREAPPEEQRHGKLERPTQGQLARN